MRHDEVRIPGDAADLIVADDGGLRFDNALEPVPVADAARREDLRARADTRTRAVQNGEADEIWMFPEDVRKKLGAPSRIARSQRRKLRHRHQHSMSPIEEAGLLAGGEAGEPQVVFERARGGRGALRRLRVQNGAESRDDPDHRHHDEAGTELRHGTAVS